MYSRPLTDLVKTTRVDPNLFVFFAKNVDPGTVGTTWEAGVCHEDASYNSIIVEYMKNDLITAEVSHNRIWHLIATCQLVHATSSSEHLEVSHSVTSIFFDTYFIENSVTRPQPITKGGECKK